MVPTRGVETVHEEMLRRAAALLRAAPYNVEIGEWLIDHRTWVENGGADADHEYVWIPETDPNWVLLDQPTDLYKCRGQRDCPDRPEVKLNRASSSQDRPRWWYYCPKHAYGRRIYDGQLQHRALVPKGATS
jgi:hypothetical protein